MFIKEYSDEQLLEFKLKYSELEYESWTKSNNVLVEILGFVTIEVNDQAPYCIELGDKHYVRLVKYTSGTSIYHYLIARDLTFRISSADADYIKNGNCFTTYDDINPSQITVNPESKP